MQKKLKKVCLCTKLDFAVEKKIKKFLGQFKTTCRRHKMLAIQFLGSFPVPPPFKIPSFMFDLRVITAKYVMLRCKV